MSAAYGPHPADTPLTHKAQSWLLAFLWWSERNKITITERKGGFCMLHAPNYCLFSPKNAWQIVQEVWAEVHVKKEHNLQIYWSLWMSRRAHFPLLRNYICMTYINIYVFICCLSTNDGNKRQVSRWNTVGLGYEDVSIMTSAKEVEKRVLILRLHNTVRIDHVMSMLDIDGLPMHRPPFVHHL